MTGDESIDRDLLLEVVRRGPMLSALREEPMDRRDLMQNLDISKSTSHRNVKSLAERGILRKSNGEHTLTEFGKAVADVVATFETGMKATARLAPLFEAVSGIDPPCPIDAFADATVTSTEYGDPFGPVARFVSLVRETDSLRMVDSYAIAPTYIDDIHGRVLNGLETEVIEIPEVAEDVMENYPTKCVELCASDFLKMRIHDDLPFGLAILDHRIGIGIRTPETGVPRVFVDTEANKAREWAETIFDSYWDEATELERFNPKALSETVEGMGK
jgi:hypothetical protein